MKTLKDLKYGKIIKVKRNYYDRAERIFKKASIGIIPGVSVLVGCNGCGKSTFLGAVEETLSNEGIKYVLYNNLHDGGSRSVSEAVWLGDFGMASSLLYSSEGECIIHNLGSVAAKCGQMVSSLKKENKKEFWLLLDATDSGMSVDNIVEIKELLFETIIKNTQESGITPYILVAANEYEMACGENCLDVQNGRYVSFKNYDDFRKFILKTRVDKEKMRSKGGK